MSKCWKLRDKDVWNFDCTLALFIADGLERLAEMTHGYPGDMADGEAWTYQLRHHAEAFRKYGKEVDGHDAVPEASLLWLAYRFGHFWD